MVERLVLARSALFWWFFSANRVYLIKLMASTTFPKSKVTTLIAAMRILANDIQSDDGVANAAIAEAGDCLEEMQRDLEHASGQVDDLRCEINDINTRNRRVFEQLKLDADGKIVTPTLFADACEREILRQRAFIEEWQACSMELDGIAADRGGSDIAEAAVKRIADSRDDASS